MTRTSRPTATAAQRTLLREGEATVRVTRPLAPPLPEGYTHGAGSRAIPQGRRVFSLERQPTQAVRVSYQVWSDPLMLADLAARSLRNASGTAVRGYATARAGKVDLGLTEETYVQLAHAAANRTSLRVVEGPVSCRVRLLEPVAGSPPTCRECKRVLGEHEVFEVTHQGAVRPTRYYLCPEVQP